MDDEAPPLDQQSTPPAAEQQRLEYWCYHCDKRVSVETLANQPDVICNECKFGFVESIPALPPSPPLFPPPSLSSDNAADEPTLGSQFLQVLRLLAQVTREEGGPHPPPQNPADPASDDDYLRIELDDWENENDRYEEEEEDENEDEEDTHSVEIRDEEEESEDQSDHENENESENLTGEGDHVAADNTTTGEEREIDIRRRRRDVLRLRLRDFATRARTEGRTRALDWAEILMGLEDNSIEFRFEMPETDRYIGDPGDYVDAAEYEALLQNLAETEGRRGAPPASKSAIESLKTVEIKSDEESYVCAVCKDSVNVDSLAKELPCGHGYHEDCIVPWLGARNSCPICRFELPTDDAEYEEEKKKKTSAVVSFINGDASSGSAAGGSSNSV